MDVNHYTPTIFITIFSVGFFETLNEKLILTEDSNVKMKTKLEELRAETERMVNLSNPEKTDLENLLNKIRDVETSKYLC